MISINLVPENLRKKRIGPNLVAKATPLPRETLIAVVGGFAVFLVAVNIFLQVIIGFKSMSWKGYENQLSKIATDRANAERVLTELRSLQSRVKSIENIMGKERTVWAMKLNAISDSVPRGVWLTSILVEEKMLRIQGSAVSKDIKDEMINIHSFTNQLKNQKDFMYNIRTMELGMIKTRKINTTQINDFTITATLKEDNAKK